MSKREPGLDLLRCIALLFVVTFHSFLNNGYYWESQSGVAMWLAGSFRWLSVACIGIFLMLTGYLKSGNTGLQACYRGLVPVLLGYFLAAAISIPIRHFVFGDEQTLADWGKRLFGFSAVYYGWYVEMYIGLVLLSPFVNRALERMTPRDLLIFGGVMLIITALPGATPLTLFPDHWRAIYPLTYYVLGAIVRRLKPEVHPALGIGGAIAVSLFLGGATVLSTDGVLNTALTWEFADIWITLIVLCLFISLYRVKVHPVVGRVLAFGAGGCYGGYLLSHLFDAWCYKLVAQWHDPEQYWRVFLCVTVPIFLVSVLLGALLDKITRFLTHRKGVRKCLK